MAGNSQCFDFVADIANSDEKKCSTRDCGDSYACDCDGSSYCEFSTNEKIVLKAAESGNCKYESKTVTKVSLVNEDINSVYQTGLSNSTCIYNENECTCASSIETGITSDCIDFKYEDSVRGSVCSIRDCKDSFHCDCGGTHRCNKEVVSKTAWRFTGQEGSAGLVLCERNTVSAVEVRIIP